MSHTKGWFVLLKYSFYLNCEKSYCFNWVQCIGHLTAVSFSLQCSKIFPSIVTSTEIIWGC